MKNVKRVFVLMVIVAVVICSCSDKPKQIEVDKVYKSMLDTGKIGDMVEIDSDMIYDMYGIESGDVKQCIAYISEDSLKADEIVLVEAIDSDKAKEIELLLQIRIESKKEESVSYSPEQYKIISSCSQIQKNENYLAMIVLPDDEDVLKVYSEAFK